MKKYRADQLLVMKGLVDTRSKAQGYILAGHVLVGTQRVEKSSELFDLEAPLIIKQKEHPYVGRGGVKLRAALDYFNIDVRGKICLDVGVSTGGFSDCLLQSGAQKIYGVDVGRGQLDWKLRSDSRVILFEKTNFKNFDISLLESTIDVVVMDVSFISATKMLPKLMEITQKKESGFCHLIVLIKPQFEVGFGQVGKGGIVKDDRVRQESVDQVRSAYEKAGYNCEGIIPSPITGQDGNIEFLMHCYSVKIL